MQFMKRRSQCNICNASFAQNGDLSRHAVAIHDGKNLSNAKSVQIAFQEKTP